MRLELIPHENPLALPAIEMIPQNEIDETILRVRNKNSMFIRKDIAYPERVEKGVISIGKEIDWKTYQLITSDTVFMLPERYEEVTREQPERWVEMADVQITLFGYETSLHRLKQGHRLFTNEELYLWFIIGALGHKEWNSRKAYMISEFRKAKIKRLGLCG